MNEDIKKHLVDIGKGLMAAALMGAGQAVIQYLTGLDWNSLLHLTLNAGAAIFAIKKV